jgi:hypothetical protein
MDDLMAKLQSVLNDEQSMKQLGELANMLSSGEPQESSAPQQDNSQPDFSQLLGSLGLGAQQTQTPPQSPPASTGNLDMAKLLKLQAIMQQANKHDKNVDLLLALRPLLKEENQVKIDRLIKIFKLFAVYPLLKDSGLLGGDLFGLL